MASGAVSDSTEVRKPPGSSHAQKKRAWADAAGCPTGTRAEPYVRECPILRRRACRPQRGQSRPRRALSCKGKMRITHPRQQHTRHSDALPGRARIRPRGLQGPGTRRPSPKVQVAALIVGRRLKARSSRDNRHRIAARNALKARAGRLDRLRARDRPSTGIRCPGKSRSMPQALLH